MSRAKPLSGPLGPCIHKPRSMDCATCYPANTMNDKYTLLTTEQLANLTDEQQKAMLAARMSEAMLNVGVVMSYSTETIRQEPVMTNTKPISDAAFKAVNDYIDELMHTGSFGGKPDLLLEHVQTAIDSEVAKAVPHLDTVPFIALNKMEGFRSIKLEFNAVEGCWHCYLGLNDETFHGEAGGYIRQAIDQAIHFASRPPLPQTPDIAKVVKMADELATYVQHLDRCALLMPWGEYCDCNSEQTLATYAVFKKENGL